VDEANCPRTLSIEASLPERLSTLVSQKSASGLPGEPVAPVMGTGMYTYMNS